MSGRRTPGTSRPSLGAQVLAVFSFIKEGKSAINLSNLGKFCQIWPQVIYLCQAGRRSPQIIYVRTAGGPENTSNIGENPNINNLT